MVVFEALESMPEMVRMHPRVGAALTALRILKDEQDALISASNAECVAAIVEGWERGRALERKAYWVARSKEQAARWESGMDRLVEAVERALDVL